MSINGLSNHLCLGGAIVVALILSSSSFDRARAADSHEFVESRQFRKNLAVSKYRNNTYWLPNYKWRQPEKYYGLRKSPPWEKNEIPETEHEKEKRKDYEKWKKMMREVTKRQREKWNIQDKKSTSDQPKSSAMSNTNINVLSKSSKKDLQNDSSKGSIAKLQNGRWGMSLVNDDALFHEKMSNLSPQKNKELTSPSLDESWEPDIEKITGENMNEMSGEKSSSRTEDAKQESHKRDRGSIKAVAQSTEAPSRRVELPLRVPFRPGGMKVSEPSTKFQKKMRAMQTPNAVIREKKGKFDEAVNMKDRENSRYKNAGANKLSIGFPSDQWDVKPGSRQVLREILNIRPQRILGFYRVWIPRQPLANPIPISDVRSRESSFLRMNLPIVLFLHLFPTVLNVRMVPGHDEKSTILKNRINFSRECFDCQT